MFTNAIDSRIGAVTVVTSRDSGHSPETMAELALAKILQVNDNAPPVIRDQALAYRDSIKEILVFYFKAMAKSERTTIYALMKKQGHNDMAEIIRRL
jgi:5,10-methenyltetrahydromethanopterin hydrogenase